MYQKKYGGDSYPEYEVTEIVQLLLDNTKIIYNSYSESSLTTQNKNKLINAALSHPLIIMDVEETNSLSRAQLYISGFIFSFHQFFMSQGVLAKDSHAFANYFINHQSEEALQKIFDNHQLLKPCLQKTFTEYCLYIFLNTKTCLHQAIENLTLANATTDQAISMANEVIAIIAKENGSKTHGLKLYHANEILAEAISIISTGLVGKKVTKNHLGQHALALLPAYQRWLSPVIPSVLLLCVASLNAENTKAKQYQENQRNQQNYWSSAITLIGRLSTLSSQKILAAESINENQETARYIKQ